MHTNTYMDSSVAPILKSAKRPKPLVLCILDGYGWNDDESYPYNAIRAANTPVMDALWQDCPTGFLNASELHVGLPEGQMGNSEVGHITLGSGRVIMQDLVRIGLAVDDGSLAHIPALTDLITKTKASTGVCHIFGLISKGGVHSHQDHVVALCKILSDNGLQVRLHAQTDGRDVAPQSALESIGEFLGAISALDGVDIATIGGRFYGMDRDKRWERVEQSYNTIVCGEGAKFRSALQAIEASYANNKTDEFIDPAVVLDGYTGINDGDSVLMINFRADRAREMATALLDKAFDGFARKKVVSFSAASSLTEYSVSLAKLMTSLFPAQSLDNVLGKVLSDAGLKQLRASETEKYPHVTYFFNGGTEALYDGEDRIMVPSPKVATYDLQPEMNAAELTDKLVAAIESSAYDVIIVNYANPDMVGHTGIMEAAIKAIEAIDVCVGRLSSAVQKAGGTMLITADHGNAEMMFDPAHHEAHTQHTENLVPAILVGAPKGINSIKTGSLADVAPTLLALLQLPQPSEMTGKVLLSTEAKERPCAFQSAAAA